MMSLRRFSASSVGTKLLIGLTGLALFVYLILHLAGNALVFAGREIFNEYSHWLISNPLILPIELALLAIFLLHLFKAISNYLKNRAARPIGYVRKVPAGRTSRKTVSSSTMIASGLGILLFVAIHVKQFKYGAWYQTAGPESVRDLYRTEIEVFSQPVWVALYVLATAIVGLHLRHGIASGFQSIGLDHPMYTRRLTAISTALAIIIGAGLGIIPIVLYFSR